MNKNKRNNRRIALGRDKGGRELAVAITQLQTSRMWLGAALKTRGYYEAQTNE